ncbi:hypothetical protein OAW36_04095, partial [Pelagibacteraceae bacterium]|nr:hypothetical protein [Pelagibacteraceae bacterium]
MKNFFYLLCVIIFLILISVITILSTTGYETDKFNGIISEKINKINKNVLLNLEKIKFKFNIQNLSLFLETNNPQFEYRKTTIPVNYVKVYLNLFSLIKSKIKIDKINVSSKEFEINQLKKIIIKTKPSNLNSLIINKVENGKLTSNLEFYFNDNQEINNFIVKGEVVEMDAIINKNLNLINTSFNFFADSSDILVKSIAGKTDGFEIKNGNIKIDKNEGTNLELELNTEILINKDNVNKYLPFSKNIKLINNSTNFSANLDHFLKISFDKTYKVNDFTYTNKGLVEELFLKFEKPVKNSYIEKNINNLSFKKSELSSRYSSD